MRILLSVATAITILAVALLILFTPVWTHFAIGASGGDKFLATPGQALDISDRTIGEVLVGPGAFAFDGPGGQPFYTADEAAHMRDVRVVLYGFLLIALASLVIVTASVLRAPRDASRWSAISRGGAGLVIAVIALGVFGIVGFDTAFTLFHEIFFPGGNWAFPADSNLIRLYPETFWELSADALGVLASLGGIATWFLARRRAAALEAA